MPNLTAPRKTNKPQATVPAPTAPWRVQLLGVPSLVRSDAAAVHLSLKDAALLALVALDGPVAAEHVAALLWPAVSSKRADTSLRQRLYRLRRDHDAHVIHGGPVLQLTAGVDTDLAGCLARVAGDEQAGREALLGELVFDALPELAEWVRQARSRWQARLDAALAAAAAQCEASGAIARGLVYAERLSSADPLSEHAQRRVMRLHYLRGDGSAAIAAFERFEQRLKHELGARPSAETIELLATIERGARALPSRRAVAPASLMRPPRLVGRDAELAALAQAWAGQRVFVLRGEAGIGKTRLLGDFVAGSEAAAGVQARPGDAGIAYAVLARLLRVLLARNKLALEESQREALAFVLPELGNAAPLAGQAQRLALQSAVESTLADAVAQGLQAVIVDDLHFADDASVECLQSLTQADPLSALHWGFAMRPADAGAATSALLLALEETQRLAPVSLLPLNGAQMTELLTSLALPGFDVPALAQALLKHSGGNPMFALETLKDMVLGDHVATALSAGSTGSIGTTAALRLPQPRTVGALVERRLAQLSPPALKLARVAALAGASFSAELAATVLEQHPLDIAEPWRELEAAQVIADGAFAHDLIFEATRASVPTPIARLLHRRIAQVLVAQQAPQASIAAHWAGAHDWARGGEAYVLAARQAQSASQRSLEVELWQQAQFCFEHARDAARSFDVRCESIQALIVVQGVAHANTVIDTLLTQATDTPQRVAALTARAMAALMAADHQVGVAAALEAGELARQLPSPWPRFEAARLHAVGLAQAGRAVEGLAVIEPLRALVEAEGSVEQQGRFWADYAYVLNTARRLRDTAHALGRATAHARTLGDLAELATLTSNLATVKGNLGHVDEALELARRALALQVQLGATDGPTGGVVETYVGLYCGMCGQYGEALERLDAALQRFRRDGQTLWVALASNHLAQLYLELGQFTRARQVLVYEAPAVASVRARGAMVAARIDAALGLRAAAAQGALQILAPAGDPYTRMLALLDEVLTLDPTAAVARCDEVQRLAGALEFAGVAMRASLLRAAALHRGDEAMKAAALLRTLLPRLGEVQPADMYVPEAWWIAVQAFDACGASDEATMALAQGIRWIRQHALPHVPEAFRDSFMQRNPVNRAMLAAASRR